MPSRMQALMAGLRIGEQMRRFMDDGVAVGGSLVLQENHRRCVHLLGMLPAPSVTFVAETSVGQLLCFGCQFVRTRFPPSAVLSALCSHVVVGRLARRLHLQLGQSAEALQQIERWSALVAD
jgi:hypothetical protein